ncbi:MAG: DUF1797 family protein [Bacilli bacterium]
MSTVRLKDVMVRLEDLVERAKEGDASPFNFGNICSVRYLNKSETFELEVHPQDNKTDKTNVYQFDNIDILTIEIFELVAQNDEENSSN